MKGFIYTALAIGSLVGMAGMTTAHAQITERMVFRTTFPFTVGAANLPAGSYTLSPASDTDLAVLKISNGRNTAIMLTIPEGPQQGEPKDNAIIFNRYGEHYVLSQVWDADDNTGAEPTGLPSARRHESRKDAERIVVPLGKIS